jgi:hypothetical protein
MKIPNKPARFHLKNEFFSRAPKLAPVSLMIVFLTWITGCIENPWQSVDSGEIVTPNVIITAENKSFTLRSGETFKPDFQSTCFFAARQGIANKWPEALDNEFPARRVRVQCGNDHFYGILALNTHLSQKYMAAHAYNYKIEIPEQYISAAKNGGRSVVYELVPLSSGANILNWILWLSDEPFK